MPKIEITPQNKSAIESQLQSYIDNQQYDLAANYMAQIRKDNPNPYIRNTLKVNYENMRRQGNIYNAGLKNATSLGAKQAFAFAFSMEQKGEFGNMSDNAFFHQYAENIDNSFNGSDYIGVRFAPQKAKRKFLGLDWLAKDIDRNHDGFSLFQEQMGLTEDQMAKQGIQFYHNSDGTVSMMISKDNKAAIYNVMKGLAKTNTRYDTNPDGDVDMDEDDVVPMFQMYGTNNKGEVTETADSFFGNQNSGNEFTEKNGKPLKEYFESDAEDAYSTKNLESIFGLQKQAMDYYKSTMKDTPSKQLSVQVFNRVQLGADGMPTDDAKFSSNEGSKDELNNLLGNTSFMDKEVYASYGGKESDIDAIDTDDITRDIEKVANGTNKDNLSSILHAVIASNGVYSYGDALVGDMLGKMIEIPAQKIKLNDDDNHIIEIPRIKIFVKDLFKDNPKNVEFANDTKVRGAREANSMLIYGYDQTIPDLYGDGNAKLAPNKDGITFTYTDSKGNVDNQLSKDDAQNLLDTKFIIDDAIDNLQEKAYNKDGTPRRGYNTKAAMTDLQSIIIGGVNEILPDVFTNVNNSLGGVLGSPYLNANGTLKKDKIPSNFELAANDIDQYNLYAQAFMRYIINGSGLTDILLARDRNDYSN